MSAQPFGKLTWDLPALARLLKVSEEDVREYFTDGRRISFLIERRLMREVFGGKLALSEGAPFDLMDADGRKWEVRSISTQGIYFCPSFMVGSGRRFEERGFILKLNAISGYVLSDIESFPDVPFWIVPSAVVRKWWLDGQLGINSKISRAKALTLLEDWQP